MPVQRSANKLYWDYKCRSADRPDRRGGVDDAMKREKGEEPRAIAMQ